MAASDREAASILTKAPRYANGAISHRYAQPSLWADFIYMAPPFLAYYAVATRNDTLLRETVRQCGLYREVLQPKVSGPYKGLWRHIIGQSQDLGLWSTGNGWATMGMARVLATVRAAKGKGSYGWATEESNLVTWIREILDGAMSSPVSDLDLPPLETVKLTQQHQLEDGLLRNYLNDTTLFGEVSGSGMLAATAYRMAKSDPGTFGSKYEKWAGSLRAAVAAHIDNSTGIASPAVNPLGWGDRTPFTTGSPEGESFAVLLYAAFRDWKGCK